MAMKFTLNYFQWINMFFFVDMVIADNQRSCVTNVCKRSVQLPNTFVNQIASALFVFLEYNLGLFT